MGNIHFDRLYYIEGLSTNYDDKTEQIRSHLSNFFIFLSCREDPMTHQKVIDALLLLTACSARLKSREPQPFAS